MIVIYLGEDLYRDSDSAISVMYKINKDGSYSPIDWNGIKNRLKRKESIHIRSATDTEQHQFFMEFNKLIEKER